MSYQAWIQSKYFGDARKLCSKLSVRGWTTHMPYAVERNSFGECVCLSQHKLGEMRAKLTNIN